MNRFLIVSATLGLGLMQMACGSHTTATSNASATCTPISDQELAVAFPPVTIDPNAKTLFTTVGTAAEADALFSKVTNSIVKGALAASPNDLGTSFQTKLANASAERQVAFTNDLKLFLEAAFGGPAYSSSLPQMVPAHSDLEITVAQYGKFINGVVVPALTANGIGTDTINLMAPVVLDPNFVKTVVTCK